MSALGEAAIAPAAAAELAEETLRRYLQPDGAYIFVMEQFFSDLPAICRPSDRQPDEWQKDFLLDFGALTESGEALYKRMLAVACKGPGKTALEAWLGWYFLATRPHCKVPCISITGGNLKDGLWAEFKKWQNRSAFLTASFTWYAERIVNNDHPETWWASKRSWSPDADTSTQATDIAGLHEDYLLWLIDECSDMPQGVVDAALAALSGGIETRVVMMGNATQTDGPLWNACTTEKDRWRIIRITGDPDDPKRSPRIDIEEARREIAQKGRDDYRVRVNILGQFPDKAADKLIDARVVDSAMGRDLADAAFMYEPKVLAADVARYGDDDSMLCRRQGRVTFTLTEYSQLATDELGDRIIATAQNWGADGVFVDGTGVGGGVVDHMRRANFRDVREVHNAEKAIDPARFENKRAECYWLAKEWLEAGGCLPNDVRLGDELKAPKFWYRKGRICIEPKEDIKARLGRSPDRADAFVLTFAGPVIRKAKYVGAGPARVKVDDTFSQRGPQGQNRANGTDYDVLAGD